MAPAAPTDAEARQLQLRELLRYNTPYWAGGAWKDEFGAWHLPGPGEFEGCAQILNKQRKRVHICPRPWQLEFDDMLEAQRARGEPMRALILKARKLGFSTWVALKFLQRLTQIEHQQAIVVAQDVKTASQIFEMAKFCHRYLPTAEELGLGFSIRPDVVAALFSATGRKFMQFGERGQRLRDNGRVGDSTLEIDTANAPEAGRGYTPSMLHMSEVARWPESASEGKMIGMLNAMPYEPETIVVLESTANGLNHFHKRWVSAEHGAADPDTGESYVTLFVPWWRDPAAAKLFPTSEDRARFEESIGRTDRYGEPAEDEPMLQEAYGCTPEQLFWRRMMIQTQHKGDVSLFNQENPHSAESAFIGSGRTVFSGVLIARAVKDAEAAPAPVVGSLEPAELEEKRTRSGTVLVPQVALWVPKDAMGAGDHELRVWEHPVKADGEWPPDVEEEDRVDGAYVVFVDVALGESNTFTEADYHAIQVFDHRTRRQVAVHRSRMDIQNLALWALLVGRYYNTAWLGVEVQGPGIVPLDTLHKTYKYPRLYRRKRYDRVRDVTEDKAGWSTDRVTKPLMEGTFATALQEGTHGLRDPRTARELNAYIINEKGKHEAQAGEHDDLLIAAMGAHTLMELLRPPAAKRRKRRRGWRPGDPVTGY